MGMPAGSLQIAAQQATKDRSNQATMDKLDIEGKRLSNENIRSQISERSGGTSGGKIVKVPKSDTTEVLGIFMGYGLKSIHWGKAYKFSQDSLMWVDSDSSTKKKRWNKYVIYAAEVPIKLDSFLAARLNKPRFDSLGKPTIIRDYIWIEPKYFRELSPNLDTTIKEFTEKYLVSDSVDKK